MVLFLGSIEPQVEPCKGCCTAKFRSSGQFVISNVTGTCRDYEGNRGSHRHFQPYCIGIETTHAPASLADPFHSPLISPLTTVYSFAEELSQDELPCNFSFDNNVHITPRLALHGALSTPSISVHLSHTVSNYTYTLSHLCHALPSALTHPGQPYTAMHVTSSTQAWYAGWWKPWRRCKKITQRTAGYATTAMGDGRVGVSGQ